MIEIRQKDFFLIFIYGFGKNKNTFTKKREKRICIDLFLSVFDKKKDIQNRFNQMLASSEMIIICFLFSTKINNPNSANYKANVCLFIFRKKKQISY